MNPPPPPPQPQPQQPPQILPHRPSISSTTCDLHPTEQFTGFCPLCLFDRLSLLDPTTTTTNPKSSTAAIKNLFKPTTTTFPELRRTKSFSVSNRETNNFSGTLFEPQRKSCDVRGRNNINTLWCLFNQPTDPHRKSVSKEKSSAVDEIEVVENYNVACSSSTNTTSCVVDSVLESKGDEFDEIRVCSRENCEDGKNVKTMKDYIDLDLHKKRNSTIAGSFMSAASGFSKKLQQKWRQKQKTNKDRKMLPVEKSIGRQYRETQSEIADYGFGRRSSCDTDPRFSLDVGRMSFDEPRVSWDGHSMARTFTRMAPPMLSVVEDDLDQVHVPRTDSQIPVEQTSGDDDEIPGGSAQTRDYYLDSSSKRRKSLDRSSSLRKITVGASEEMTRPVSNARVSPKSLDRSSSLRKTTAAASVLAPQSEEMMKPVSNARVSPDDCADAFKMGFRDNASIMGDGEKREASKKSSRWSKALNIWGLIIQRRGGVKEHNGAEFGRSFSQSWQDVRIEHNGDARGDFNRNMFRSNSSVNWRNANGFEGSTSFRSSSVRKTNNVDMNWHDKKRKDEFVPERNRTARYSPNHVDNGLLRFYLNPLAGKWRSSSTGKSRPNHTHSIARSVLGLY